MKKNTVKQPPLKERSEGKRGSSFSHLSAHFIESAAATAIGCGRLFQVDYLSPRGKWVHLAKLLSVVFIPILGGWVFTLYSIADNVIERSGTVEVSIPLLGGWVFILYSIADNVIERSGTVEAQTLMMRAIKLGRLIHTIQKERDMSILYISEIGPGTKAFLLQQYVTTDDAFADMWDWPAEFARHPKKFFQTKRNLMNHINTHRNKLDRSTSDVYGEITFYIEIVEFFMQWMLERIRESGFGNIWKSLVAFQKITQCMLDSGAERAYGTMFFARGNFPDTDLYDNYSRRIFRFNSLYRSSTFYSDLVDPLLDTKTDQTSATKTIRALRTEIKYSNVSGSYLSKDKAESYYDNISSRVDFLFSLQTLIASRIINRINMTINEYAQNIIIYSITASVVILSCPFIMYFTESLTSTMQSYTKVLVKASDELKKEKSKTDTILYQILPKAVAERLKRKSQILPEFFKSSTVMFTNVVDFTRLSIEYSAFEIVDLLNILYTCIDEKIEKYDVYKVETINDTYMVVSGVPVRNGDRHASEIAYLALDIVSMVRSNMFMATSMKNPVHLMLGISTGPVSAGVVGTVQLRYCLFGDTVNTASRMRSYSQPNRIHISEATYRNLKKTDAFKMTPRGKCVIKGKGEMETYWLVDSSRMYDITPGTSTWHLPGQTETDSSASIQAQQGTSQRRNE